MPCLGVTLASSRDFFYFFMLHSYKHQHFKKTEREDHLNTGSHFSGERERERESERQRRTRMNRTKPVPGLMDPQRSTLFSLPFIIFSSLHAFVSRQSHIFPKHSLYPLWSNMQPATSLCLFLVLLCLVQLAVSAPVRERLDVKLRKPVKASVSVGLSEGYND